jgi:hypothetical protein
LSLHFFVTEQLHKNKDILSEQEDVAAKLYDKYVLLNVKEFIDYNEQSGNEPSHALTGATNMALNRPAAARRRSKSANDRVIAKVRACTRHFGASGV